MRALHDTVRASLAHPVAVHTVLAAHATRLGASSIIGRVPGVNAGLDRLRAFPGVALPSPVAAPREGEAAGDPGGDDGGGAADAMGGLDYDHMGRAVLCRALRMRPSEWRCAGQLARLDPDDAALRYLLLAVQMVQSELPTPLLLLCRKGDRSPIEVWTELADEERRALAEGRAAVTVLGEDGAAGVLSDLAALVAATS